MLSEGVALARGLSPVRVGGSPGSSLEEVESERKSVDRTCAGGGGPEGSVSSVTAPGPLLPPVPGQPHSRVLTWTSPDRCQPGLLPSRPTLSARAPGLCALTSPTPPRGGGGRGKEGPDPPCYPSPSRARPNRTRAPPTPPPPAGLGLGSTRVDRGPFPRPTPPRSQLSISPRA